MLCPTIFEAMCHNFRVCPVIDLFVIKAHHQLPRYYSADPNDARAEGYNAFDFHWSPDVVLYANPPWSLIDQVLEKVVSDCSRIILVASFWTKASWYLKLCKLLKDHSIWT